MVCPHPPQKRLTSSLAPPAASWAVTQALLAGFGSDSRTINIFDRHTDLSHVDIGRDDIAFLAVPCYGGRVPALAAQRIAQINGNGAKAVARMFLRQSRVRGLSGGATRCGGGGRFSRGGCRGCGFGAFDRASVCLGTPGQGRHRPFDGVRQGTQESRRRKSLPCSSESSGQPSVQKGVKSDDHPQTGVRLHILRHLC